MGASPNRRAYDMFGHAEPDRGANPCPYGWFGFKDSCYLLSSDDKPWVNAAVSGTNDFLVVLSFLFALRNAFREPKLFFFFRQIKCASMHAHLACIETAEENEFLRRLLKEIRGKLQLLKSEIIYTVSIVYKSLVFIEL